MEAYKANELVVIHPNHTGAGARIYGAVSDAGVNVKAFCGYTVGEKAVLTMVTEDNPRAKRALRKAGISVDERPIVCVLVPNRAGMFREIAARLAAGGVDIDYAYASVGAKSQALVVLQTSNDRKALRLLTR